MNTPHLIIFCHQASTQVAVLSLRPSTLVTLGLPQVRTAPPLTAAAGNPTIRPNCPHSPRQSPWAVLKSGETTGGKALCRLWVCEGLRCCVHLTQRAKRMCPQPPQSPVDAECPWPTTSSRAGLEAASHQRSCLSILNAISPPPQPHLNAMSGPEPLPTVWGSWKFLKCRFDLWL